MFWYYLAKYQQLKFQKQIFKRYKSKYLCQIYNNYLHEVENLVNMFQSEICQRQLYRAAEYARQLTFKAATNFNEMRAVCPLLHQLSWLGFVVKCRRLELGLGLAQLSFLWREDGGEAYYYMPPNMPFNLDCLTVMLVKLASRGYNEY